MKRRHGIIVSVTGIFIVLLALIGITYGYYATRVSGNTNTNSVYLVAADLRLIYSDGTTEILTKENIMPGMEIGTKDFSVTNEGEEAVEEYNVYFENVINQFVNTDDVKMTITCSSSKGTSCNGFDGTFPTVGSKLVSNSIDLGETHTYNLSINYEETGYDQSDDMGKVLAGRVQIYEPKSIITLSGSVLNAEEGYYVEWEEGGKTSQLNGNRFTIPGVSTGKNRLYLKYIDGSGNEQIVASKIVDISKATTSGVKESVTVNVTGTTVKVVITEDTKEIAIDIDADSGTYGAGVKNPYGVITEMLVNPTNSLAYTIIDNAFRGDGVDNARFMTIPSTTPAVETSGTSNEMSVSPDEFTKTTGVNSFYYRGKVTNNYLNFAGMCWRIVRVQGDGSVKLILEDNYNECQSSTGNWNISSSTASLGYDRNYLTDSSGNTSSNPVVNLNYLSGSGAAKISTLFQNFQSTLESNVSNYYGVGLSDRLKSGGWCYNDNVYYQRNLVTDISLINDYKVSNTGFDYSAAYKLASKHIASYECDGSILNNFSDGTSMYVATLTAEEVAFAGGDTYTHFDDYYLINDFQITGGTSQIWWTMSPRGFSNYLDGGLQVVTGEIYNTNGTVYTGIRGAGVNAGAKARPSIILKSGIEFTEGIGTIDEPYVIE